MSTITNNSANEPKNVQGRDFLVFAIFFGILFIINAILFASGHLKFTAEGFGIITAVIFTLGLYSFLFADNPLFKLCEHFYVGVATAYMLIVTWYSTLLPDLFDAFKTVLVEPWTSASLGKLIAVSLPTILGLLVYTRGIPGLGWPSRITFAIIIGFGAGLSIPNLINAYILGQLKASMIPLWSAQAGLDWGAIIIFIGVITTLIYFFFSLEHRGPVGWAAKLGIWFLMISFGASFGFTVMARFSLLIERVNFLFKDWIPLIH